MTKERTATISDVARLAGVSTATISRVLNEPDKVSAETRKRVHGAIETLGYTPNFGGRFLAAGRSNTIGAVIPTMSNAMFAGGLQAFQEVLARAGRTLLVASTGYHPQNELLQIRTLIARGAEGLLLIGRDRPEETRAYLTRRRVPYVLTWCRSFHPDEIYVGFDNFEAARDVTRRVLALGHRDIAMISGMTEHNDRARDRQNGMRDVIAADGRAQLVGLLEVDYDLHEGAKAFRQFLSGPTPPTAIICGNDVLAAGAILAARQMGIAVPGRVSVVGFDDIELAELAFPALTTVRVPQIQMGHRAAELLLKMVEDKGAAVSELLPTEFINRDSLSSPPA